MGITTASKTREEPGATTQVGKIPIPVRHGLLWAFSCSQDVVLPQWSPGALTEQAEGAWDTHEDLRIIFREEIE